MSGFSEMGFEKQEKIWKDFVTSKPGTKEEMAAMISAKKVLAPEIYDSWIRSKCFNVNPFTAKSEKLTESSLKKVIEDNKLLIGIANPYLKEFYSFLDKENYAVLLADVNGTIISLAGGSGQGMRANMHHERLEVGNSRSECYSGTNGISMCIETKKPIQIVGKEHYVHSQQGYTSSAAPIYDENGNIIGCLNIFGRSETSHLHTLAMVVVAANGITKEMKLKRSYYDLNTLKRRLETTIEFANTGLVMTDNYLIIKQHNNLIEKMTGLKFEQLHNRDIREVFKKTDIFNTDKDIQNMEVNGTLSNDKKYAFNISVSLIKNKSGKKNGIVVAITEMKQIRMLVKKNSGFTAKYTFDSIIGGSEEIAACKQLGKIAAESISNVLILGENGTGKELFAQAIHNAGDRKGAPFVAINCASIPKDLIESELFGYEAGAFTGASKQGQPGKFELADGGTIFLDEIGDMPLNLQATLLRALQVGEIVRIGGKESKNVDVRIIAATNHDLLKEVEQERFRRDLYYRLNVLTIKLPPLREHREDISKLSYIFLNRYSMLLNKNVNSIADDVQRTFLEYSWPGNIRELENVIERAVNVTQDNKINMIDIPAEIYTNRSKSEMQDDIDDQNKYDMSMCNIKNREKEMILIALKSTDGNVKRAAQMLGIGRRTIYNKIIKYKIDISGFRVQTK